MRRFTTKLAVAGSVMVAVLGSSAPAHEPVQRDFSTVEVTASKVAGNVWMLQGAGGNIGVSTGPDGILIVDDQFAPLADKIRAALKGLGDGKLRFVLNTHWHPDHTGGNVEFGPEAPIIAHGNVRRRLETEQKGAGRVVAASPKEALPVITFDESLSVHFNDEEIRVLHYPHGHTDGDSVIFFTRSNVVHMGDDFFNGMFPFVDIDSGGDVEGLIRNIEEVALKLPADVKIIPGHGPLASLDDLKKFHKMLVDSVVYVRERTKQGKTLAEIQAEGVPEAYKSWTSPFIDGNRWLEIVHRSLSKGVPMTK
jgi:glyoxylase-like metal-dependent hydrolase (beta-lactamase superfamily II)